MQQEGVAPDDRIFVGALKACSCLATLEDGREADGKVAKAGCLEKGRAIHSQVLKSGFECDVFVATSLVDMYAKCGSMIDAQHVFDQLQCRDAVSWNAMILGYAQKEEGELALQFYARMQQEGVKANGRTFVSVLKACSSLAAQEEDEKFLKLLCLEKGRSIHFQVVKGGFESDIFVGTTLVDMYASCGDMVCARHVFDKLPQRNVVSWTSMISGYADQGESEKALKLYAQMQEQGLLPNSTTFISILKACGNTAALETGNKIHGEMCRDGFEAFDRMAETALVDMYGKCGSMVDAQKVFDEAAMRDLVTWNALIAGYARHGESEAVFDLFKRMSKEDIQCLFNPIL